MDFNKVIEKILKYSSYGTIILSPLILLFGIGSYIDIYFKPEFWVYFKPFLIWFIGCLFWGAYNYLCYRIMKVCNVYIYRNEVLPPPEYEDPTNNI